MSTSSRSLTQIKAVAGLRGGRATWGPRATSVGPRARVGHRWVPGVFRPSVGPGRSEDHLWVLEKFRRLNGGIGGSRAFLGPSVGPGRSEDHLWVPEKFRRRNLK